MKQIRNQDISYIANKGITLLALVITIVILVILVGVTINTAIHYDFFNHTKKGTEAYKTSREQEDVILSEYEKWATTGEIGHLHSYYYDTDTTLKCYCGETATVTPNLNKFFLVDDSGTIQYKSNEAKDQFLNSFTGELVLPTKIEDKEITNIPKGFLLGVENLTKLTIPAGVTSIGQQAFASCPDLQEVILPPTLNDIKAQAFEACSFSNINIPKGTESIGTQAFSNCTKIEKVYIPNTIKTIGERAFLGCSNLTTIYINMEREDWNKVSIGDEWLNETKVGDNIKCIGER